MDARTRPPRIAAAVLGLATAFALPAHSASSLVASSSPRVMAMPEPALSTRITRVPGASMTLNPWGPARWGSATPSCSRRIAAPSWGHSLGTACAPTTWTVLPAPTSCHVVTPRPLPCDVVAYPQPVYWPPQSLAGCSPGGSVVLAGGGLTISVGLPCGCASVHACSHRRF